MMRLMSVCVPNTFLRSGLFAVLVAPLLACQVQPRGTDVTATAHSAALALEAIDGCGALAKAESLQTAGSAADAVRRPLVANKVVAARLHEISEVNFALDPKKPQRPGQRGGLIALTAPATGTFLLGSASMAWVELVEQDLHRVVAPRSYEWVELCGRRMKAGIFQLRAGARYLIQLSASPDATVDLFISGPIASSSSTENQQRR